MQEGQRPKEITLSALALGQTGVIRRMTLTGGIYQRLLDLGFVEGRLIMCTGQGPLGDPKAYRLSGGQVALRQKDSRYIFVSLSETGERP